MKNQEINVQVNGDTLIIREGQAPVIHEKKIIAIGGIISNPAEWLSKRKELVDGLSAHLLVNREKMNIKLVIDETNHFSTEISGSLQLHPDFLKFGINSGEYLTPFDMATLFKMNRNCFENQSAAMNLVNQLQGFKAKVQKELENADNNRGDRKVLIDQTVKSNIPESFNLFIPVFKGQLKQTFEVEIYINASDLTCCLMSPAANDLMAQVRDTAIDAEIAKIKDLNADIAILEQ